MTEEICPCCVGTGHALDSWAIGTQLRFERIKRGISMDDMCEAMGISKSELSLLERGKRSWMTKYYLSFQENLKTLPNREFPNAKENHTAG